MPSRDTARILMRATPHLDASTFSLRVELALPGVAGNSPAFTEAIGLYVAGVNAGVFGGQRFDPARSAAAVTAWRPTDEATVDIACQGVERGAVRVLANLLRRSLAQQPASVRVLLASGADDRLAATSAIGVDTLAYPLAPQDTPFAVDILSPERSLDPLHVRLGFADALSERELDLAAEELRIWIELVRRGAYLDPAADLAGLPAADEVEIYQLSSSQVEAVLYGFGARDEAFDGLIGLLMRLGPKLGAGLESVQAW